MRDLRPYQLSAVEQLRAAIKRLPEQRGGILLQLATGAGKTHIAASMIREAARRGWPVWFLAHRDEIIDATIERLEAFGLTVGRIQAGHDPSPLAEVQVCSIDTLSSWIQRGIAPGKRPRLVFIDEAHHLASETWMGVFSWLNCLVIGLSATPYRSDGSGLGCGFSEVVVGATPRELVDLGFLVPARIYTAPQEDQFLHGDVVDMWVKHSGQSAVVFASSIEHSQKISEAFNERGFPWAHIDGESDREYRRLVLEKLERGELAGVSNVSILTEGWNFPSLRCVILAHRTESEGKFVQTTGRGARSAPGKDHFVLLDHGGNALRFGDPLAHRPADMSGRKEKRKNLTVEEQLTDGLKACDSCMACMPKSAKVCPYCGARSKVSFIPNAKKTLLRRLTDEEIKKLEQRKSELDDSTVAQRRAFWLRTAGAVRSMGANPWGADNTYKKKYGVKPTDDDGVISKSELGAYWSERRSWAKKKRTA